MKNNLLQTWREKTTPNMGSIFMVIIMPFTLFIITVIAALNVAYNVDIFNYAQASNLPSTTVLMRLGYLDITIVIFITVLTLILLSYNFFRLYIVNISKKIIGITCVCVLFGIVIASNSSLKNSYGELANNVETPLRAYFKNKANSTMKTAQLEMGTIVSVDAIGVNTFKVVVKTAQNDETFTMNAPAIPAKDTPIWIAYKKDSFGDKIMTNMGVLPIRL